jgi:Tol biopolymer transport system component
VLELVEGPTLADRLASGPLTIGDAVAIARQIADALDAAHEAGIVHRDLKPANIKIRPDGVVKVLDFGLAKYEAGKAGQAAFATNAPTVTIGGTREGTLLGTVAYMSPEQARGLSVDKRTDIWSFGCVLYEMLSGRMAFAGQTSSDTIAAILEREPDWTALPQVTPLSIQRLLKRCCEKDARRRLRDIGDVAIEIEGRIDGDGSAEPATIFVRRRAREYVGWSVAAVAAVGLILAFSVPRAFREAGPAPPIVRTSLVLPIDQQFGGVSVGPSPLVLSPDGARLVYVATWNGRSHLFVRELGEFDARVIPGTEEAEQPFFSPDGKWVAFFADGALQKVAIGGGTPLRICEVASDPTGGSWGPDDAIVFASSGSPLSKVAVGGGTPQAVANSSGGRWPEILPDGKHVLFSVNEAAIITMALDGSDKRIVARQSHFAGDGPSILGEGDVEQVRYSPTGHLVFGQGLRVMAASFVLGSLALTSSPVPVLDWVNRGGGGGAVYFAMSKTGVLVYAPESKRELTWVDREGRATPVFPVREVFRFPRLSPDGKHIAVVSMSETRRSDIWVYDTDSGARVRLASGIMPVWSPDGKRVAFGSSEGGIAWQPADGSETMQVLHSVSASWPTSWSSDGKALLFNDGSNPTNQLDVWALLVGTTERSRRPVFVKPGSDAFAYFSPDDRWIAYSSRESGRGEVYVTSYPDLTGKTPVSTDGGGAAVWSRDGRELFYRRGNAMMAAAVDTTNGFRAQKPRLLFEGPYYVGAGGDLSFDVAPDGRFLMIRGDEASVGRQLNVVSNWFDELTRRVASGNR